MLTKEFNGSERNKLLYTELFLSGCKYAEFVYIEKDTDKIKVPLMEVMKKLLKAGELVDSIKGQLNSLQAELLSVANDGVDGIGATTIETSIENILAQLKGALDIFANQYLGEMIGYRGNWKHQKIITQIKQSQGLDKEVVAVIEKVIVDNDDGWLRKMIDDRNAHHQANLGLKNLIKSKKGPIFITTGGEQIKPTDLESSMNRLWENVFFLTRDLMQLTFWAKAPALKGIVFSREYFLGK